jgi:hypothetical protein
MTSEHKPFGGATLPEPLVFTLDHPVRHLCRTYTELRFHRRAAMSDIAAYRRAGEDRRGLSVVIARLAKVPRAVVDKLHPKDLLDLVNGTAPLFKLD